MFSRCTYNGINLELIHKIKENTKYLVSVTLPEVYSVAYTLGVVPLQQPTLSAVRAS